MPQSTVQVVRGEGYSNINFKMLGSIPIKFFQDSQFQMDYVRLNLRIQELDELMNKPVQIFINNSIIFRSLNFPDQARSQCYVEQESK
mmetsp:Transcript_14066/g.23897  ORF Transcript_14066/g.23897 Transcript_14066/m.23897 type:complete len:88 (-) Transcript_14066:36-299(-)